MMATNRPFSYRLKMEVEPKWAEIIKRVVSLEDAKGQENFGNNLKDYLQSDRMLHRRYDFTEFFDAASGMTIRFQRVHIDDKIHSGFVGEFGDAGYLLGRNNPLMPEKQREKYQIAISEYAIDTECFDRHTGRLMTLGGNRLFSFPIDAVLEFGIALNLRFPDLNTNHVIKWPDKVETALQKAGTKYETMFDFSPDERNLETEDQQFFRDYGRPMVAEYESWPSPLFEGPCCSYGIELEVFTPETAKKSSRLAYPNLTGESLLDL
jgi:hypothetical protein